MTDKQIIIDEIEINPNDWLEPYKPIPACEIKDCDHLVYAGNNIYGCRIAEDGLVCDDFNNDDECCMYRQLEYYKEALKAKEQECEELNKIIEEAKNSKLDLKSFLVGEAIQNEYEEQLDQLKAENKHLNNLLNQALKELEELQNLKDEDSLRVVILARENERLKELLAQDRCFQDKSHKCVKSFYIDERYKQAIEKIKEIAQFACEKSVCDRNHCDYCSDGQILQICDEVNK